MENNDYNNEPVFFCKHCLSLAILDGGVIDYCADCGSTDIEQNTLEEYDVKHYKKYGTKLFY